MKSVELNIFTNSTINAPSTDHIDQCYNSFIKIFGNGIKTRVWCDPKPNLENSEEFISRLKKKFDNIFLTESLSDGYVKALNLSDSNYMFMLEHDHILLDTIKHSLDEIIDQMEYDNLWYLRFNRRENQAMRTDRWLEEKQGKHFKYCVTPAMSNTPHIIKRETYKEIALPHIKISEGSYGIEQILNKKRGINGNLYGPLGYEKTSHHLDGRFKEPRK
jgi:hypothetical protein